ncbi:MAG: hypothetical protein AAF196_08980 [Planctomycetota bacterium]
MRKALPISNLYAMGEFQSGLVVEYGQSTSRPQATGTEVLVVQFAITSWTVYFFGQAHNVDPMENPQAADAMAAAAPEAESAADLLEAIATDVEQCLLADRSLGGLAIDVQIDGWQVQPPNGAEQAAIAKAVHRVSVELRQDANNPTTYGEPRFDDGVVHGGGQ